MTQRFFARKSTTSSRTERRGLLKKLLGAFAGGVALSGVPAAIARPASALGAPPMGTDSYLGSIGIFAGNFAPRGWAACDGQLLSIAQNTALFSLLGTTYGGNGQTTFALPDLRGRVPMHVGQGPGLTNRVLGEQGGSENVTLLVTQIPSHNHALNANTAPGTTDQPQNNLPAKNAAGVPQYAGSSDTTMAPTAIGPAGGSQAHNNMQPFLVLMYCIAVEGIYPSRN